MSGAYLKVQILMLAALLIFCPKTQASADTIPSPGQIQSSTQPIYFLNEKEIDRSILKKLDPKAVEKIDIVKGLDAAKEYGIRGRFGVVRITTRKTPVPSKKTGLYSLTLYFYGDTAKNVKTARYSGKNLDTLFHRIVKEHLGADLVIDELRFRNDAGEYTYLNMESRAFSLIYSRHNIDSVSKTVAELLFYSAKYYRSGKFYFSGTNFSNVVSCSANHMNCVQSNLKRCTIGTIIILEACQYKKPDNTYEFINKSIKLD